MAEDKVNIFDNCQNGDPCCVDGSYPFHAQLQMPRELLRYIDI